MLPCMHLSLRCMTDSLYDAELIRVQITTRTDGCVPFASVVAEVRLILLALVVATYSVHRTRRDIAVASASKLGADY